MTVVNHLKGNQPESKFLEVAFNRHLIEGDLSKSKVSGSHPTHVVTIQQMLGDALGYGWKGVVGAWFRGTLRPSTKYEFYPGIMSPGNGDSVQGIDSVFDKDTPHSNIAWIRLECPSGTEVGIPEFNTKDNPPKGFFGIFDCQTGDVYDEAGEVVDSDVLLVNPADVIIFGSLVIRRFAPSRLDFESLAVLRDLCDQTETPDYTTLPEGYGLTAKYFQGSAFDTFKNQRVDPVIQFESSSGAPSLDIDADNFSARYEGKIRFRYNETYTFYLTHDGGGKLWVNGVLIVDQWATTGEHSGTFNATADAYVDIKIEWNDTSGNAQLKLEWQSTSQAREVVTQDRLYPKSEAVPKFRTGLAFTQRTNFDDFVRQVLMTCNGAFQDYNGKLSFFNIDALASSFAFNETNIIKNTFKFSPRFTQQDLLKLPNRFIADGRDLESRFLEPFGNVSPEVVYDVPELQEIAGRVIEEKVYVGSATRWQALKNLTFYAKLKTAQMVCNFEGMPQTFPVLPGDKVTITHSLSNWTNKLCLCLEATDKGIGKSADERIFKHIVWE